MNAEESEAYEEGYLAYLENVALSSNPYQGTLRKLWCDGWIESQIDDQGV